MQGGVLGGAIGGMGRGGGGMMGGRGPYQSSRGPPACNFCGRLDHFIRECPRVDEFVAAGKCIQGEGGQCKGLLAWSRDSNPAYLIITCLVQG